MSTYGFIILFSVIAVIYTSPNTHGCTDHAFLNCAQLQKYNTDLCSNPCVASSLCANFCGACKRKCYKCSNLDRPEDCTTTQVCGHDQVCIVSQTFTGSLQLKFQSGCVDKSVCNVLYGGIKAKRSITYDGGCCDSNLCNGYDPDVPSSIPHTTAGMGMTYNSSTNIARCQDLHENICSNPIYKLECYNQCFASSICPVSCGFCQQTSKTDNVFTTQTEVTTHKPITSILSTTKIHSTSHSTSATTKTYPTSHSTSVTTKTYPTSHSTSATTKTYPTSHSTSATTKTHPTSHSTSATTNVQIRCYVCEYVANIEDCKQIDTCDSGEVCLLLKTNSTNPSLRWKLQCASKHICDAHSFTVNTSLQGVSHYHHNVHQKFHGYCCSRSLCNGNNTTVPVTTTPIMSTVIKTTTDRITPNPGNCQVHMGAHRCPRKFFLAGSTCYHFAGHSQDNKMAYDMAQKYCHEKCSRLTIISGISEAQKLTQYLLQHHNNDQSYWIDGVQNAYGTWLWASTNQTIQSNLMKNHGVTLHKTGNCLTFGRENGMSNYSFIESVGQSCSYIYHPLCEYSLTNDP